MNELINIKRLQYFWNKVKAVIAGKADKQELSALDTRVSANEANINVLRGKAIFMVVESLPESGEDNIIYLVPSDSPTDKNYKNEYMWINNTWEMIGSTSISLEGYATTENVDILVNEVKSDIGSMSFEDTTYIQASTNIASALIALDTAVSSVDTLYELYKKCGGTLPEKVFPTFVKYFFTPFMISSSSVTTIPNDLLNDAGTNFINEYYWQICRLTGGEPVKTLQWNDTGAPSRIQGMASKKEFTIDYTNKKITPA